MKNFPIEHEGKIYWISRAIGVAGYIFCYDDELKILANKRGSGTPDFQGYWNCPCGYLDFDETTAQACSREIKEETGLEVTEIQYLFSSPNEYVYSGMGIHTLDMDYLARVHCDSVAVTAHDDAAEAMWIPINKVNPAEFGLTSIRNAVIRFLSKTLIK